MRKRLALTMLFVLVLNLVMSPLAMAAEPSQMQSQTFLPQLAGGEGTQDASVSCAGADCTPADTIVIKAKALDDYACIQPGSEDYYWHWVITGVLGGIQPPQTLDVTHADGSHGTANYWKTVGNVAHYIENEHLDSPVTETTAVIDASWDGNFNLSSGPCPEPTETPTPEPEVTSCDMLTSEPNPIELGEATLLTISSTNPYGFKLVWNGEDLYEGIEPTYLFTPVTATNHLVRGYVQDSDGEWVTSQSCVVMVKVNEPPVTETPTPPTETVTPTPTPTETETPPPPTETETPPPPTETETPPPPTETETPPPPTETETPPPPTETETPPPPSTITPPPPPNTCSEQVIVEGEWSEWFPIPDNPGWERHERTVWAVDADDQSVICEEWPEWEERSIPLCQETTKQEGKWSLWHPDPNREGWERRDRTITLWDEYRPTELCGEWIEGQVRPDLDYNFMTWVPGLWTSPKAPPPPSFNPQEGGLMFADPRYMHTEVGNILREAEGLVRMASSRVNQWQDSFIPADFVPNYSNSLGWWTNVELFALGNTRVVTDFFQFSLEQTDGRIRVHSTKLLVHTPNVDVRVNDIGTRRMGTEPPLTSIDLQQGSDVRHVIWTKNFEKTVAGVMIKAIEWSDPSYPAGETRPGWEITTHEAVITAVADRTNDPKIRWEGLILIEKNGEQNLATATGVMVQVIQGTGVGNPVDSIVTEIFPSDLVKFAGISQAWPVQVPGTYDMTFELPAERAARLSGQ